MFSCRFCNRVLPASSFSPSRIRTREFYCTRCCYQRYVSRSRQRNPLLRAALALDRRERRRCIDTAKYKQLNQAEAELIVKRFEGRSVISGRTLHPVEVCFERRDLSLPFHPVSNAVLIGANEQRFTQRLRSLHFTNPATLPLSLLERE